MSKNQIEYIDNHIKITSGKTGKVTRLHSACASILFCDKKKPKIRNENLQSALSKKKISQKTKRGHKEYTKQAPFENHIRNRKNHDNQEKEPSLTKS